MAATDRAHRPVSPGFEGTFGMLKGFKDFFTRGNVIDLAVAFVIGAAFAALVSGFVGKIITPILNAVGGANMVNGLGFSIRHGSKEIEQTTFVDIGGLINLVIVFFITAAVVYFIFVLPKQKYDEIRARFDKNAAVAEEEKVSEDVALLREIRDALVGQGSSSPHVPPASDPTA
jgi:large conductance mechanosensitive channel